MNTPLVLRWLQPEFTGGGTTWGMPWKEGEFQRNDTIVIESEQKKVFPVQTWPTAYWPDGSVKWTAHAAVVDASGGFRIVRGHHLEPTTQVTVCETEDSVIIDTGRMTCIINRHGEDIIRSIVCNGQVRCRGGRLLCIREMRNGSIGNRSLREESFRSRINLCRIEHAGPQLTVICLEGKHRAVAGEREWLPFAFRLYFYSSATSLRMVHTFVFDGDAQTDFIKGIGVQFDTPMSGPFYNRHIRFAGDCGIFAEPLQLLSTWRPRTPIEIYRKQLDGHPLHLDDTEDAAVLKSIQNLPTWGNFKIFQDSANHYTIRKQTRDGFCWIDAVHGNRSRGLVYAGDETGGMAVGLRDFWQKHPTALAIDDMAADCSHVTAWFWSPDAQPMDLRHYDDRAYVDSYYEGFDEPRSTPYGIANTNELTVHCFDTTPAHDALWQLAENIQHPPQLVCLPEHYHAKGAFGPWAPVDRSTPARRMIEDRLDQGLEFYRAEVERRRWYGFWNYGDFMHSYDEHRHSWCYDMGGKAWQNTELLPTYWLWYTFLRTGSAEAFRMAEAMARHTSEVDLYHQGEYAGLGSRHNVIHWGCGCKEARIAMAGHHRFYYYLTADARIGDVMRDVKDADFATVHLDPMRFYHPKDRFPTHTRIGPDWSAFCSNWMTMWERFEDMDSRNKLLAGIESIKKLPFQLCGGVTLGYDPVTGRLMHMGKEHEVGYGLMLCMGGPQVWIELAGMLKDPVWEQMLVDYGEFYDLSPEEKHRRTSGGIDGRSGWNTPIFATTLQAFAAARTGDRALARRVLDVILEYSRTGGVPGETIGVNGPDVPVPVVESPGISTNSMAVWAVNAIVALAFLDNADTAAKEESRS